MFESENLFLLVFEPKNISARRAPGVIALQRRNEEWRECAFRLRHDVEHRYESIHRSIKSAESIESTDRIGSSSDPKQALFGG